MMTLIILVVALIILLVLILAFCFDSEEDRGCDCPETMSSGVIVGNVMIPSYCINHTKKCNKLWEAKKNLTLK